MWIFLCDGLFLRQSCYIFDSYTVFIWAVLFLYSCHLDKNMMFLLFQACHFLHRYRVTATCEGRHLLYLGLNLRTCELRLFVEAYLSDFCSV